MFIPNPVENAPGDDENQSVPNHNRRRTILLLGSSISILIGLVIPQYFSGNNSPSSVRPESTCSGSHTLEIDDKKHPKAGTTIENFVQSNIGTNPAKHLFYGDPTNILDNIESINPKGVIIDMEGIATFTGGVAIMYPDYCDFSHD